MARDRMPAASPKASHALREKTDSVLDRLITRRPPARSGVGQLLQRHGARVVNVVAARLRRIAVGVELRIVEERAPGRRGGIGRIAGDVGLPRPLVHHLRVLARLGDGRACIENVGTARSRDCRGDRLGILVQPIKVIGILPSKTPCPPSQPMDCRKSRPARCWKTLDFGSSRMAAA